MNKKILSLGALVVALAVAAVVVIANPFTLEAQTTNLPKLTQQDAKSDKPLVVVVAGAKDSALVAQLAAQASKHPGVKFLQADAATVGAPDEALPALIVFVPGVGPTFQKANFAAPADLDAFIAKRVKFAIEEADAAKALSALQQDLATKSKPFQDELLALNQKAQSALAPIQAKAAEATKDLKAQAEEINGRLEKALGTLPQDLFAALAAGDEKKVEEIQGQIEKAQAPFQQELATVRAQAQERLAPFRAEAATALKPFQDQAAEINTRRTAAVGTLEAEVAQKEEALVKLIEAHGADQN